MKVITGKHNEVILRIEEGDRYIQFRFSDGRMVSTTQSMGYHKTKQDWEFYWKAIKKMLSVSKDYYADQEKLPLPEIPF